MVSFRPLLFLNALALMLLVTAGFARLQEAPLLIPGQVATDSTDKMESDQAERTDEDPQLTAPAFEAIPTVRPDPVLEVVYRNGEWQDGIRTGYGTWKDDTGLRYSGEFKDGEFHGYGVAFFPYGGQYRGQWKHGEKHGHGRQTLANGDRYDGQFNEGQYHGRGTLETVTGESYTGDWVRGRMTGDGTLSFSDGMLYVGEFRDGEFQGWGTLTYPDGRSYEGQFARNHYHGQGTLHGIDGTQLDGQFEHGTPKKELWLTTAEGGRYQPRSSKMDACFPEGSDTPTACPDTDIW